MVKCRWYPVKWNYKKERATNAKKTKNDQERKDVRRAYHRSNQQAPRNPWWHKVHRPNRSKLLEA